VRAVGPRASPPFDPGQQLRALDVHGNRSPFASITSDGTVDASSTVLRRLALAPPAPNPIGEDAEFRFSTSVPGVTRLSVFDAAGRLVSRPVDATLPEGEHSIRWSGGRALRGGLYFLQLESEGVRLSRRFVFRPEFSLDGWIALVSFVFTAAA
jgi:hypothetical protein